MYQKINKLNIYYQKTGQGKDLIMLHGWGQDASTWWGVVDLLKDHFTLWLLDLPGFGRSVLPQKPFTISDYADIVAEFIKKSNLSKPSLLGHSLGGNIAIKLSSEFPELIDKLILVSSSGIRPNRRIVNLLITPLAKVFHYLIPDLGFKEKLRFRFYQALESDYPTAEKLKETLVNILNEDLINQLPKIKSETLILWGEKDQTISLKYAKKMYQVIEDSRLEVFDDVGHFPHLEAPVLFAQYVKDFS